MPWAKCRRHSTVWRKWPHSSLYVCAWCNEFALKPCREMAQRQHACDISFEHHTHTHTLRVLFWNKTEHSSVAHNWAMALHVHSFKWIVACGTLPALTQRAVSRDNECLLFCAREHARDEESQRKTVSECQRNFNVVILHNNGWIRCSQTQSTGCFYRDRRQFAFLFLFKIIANSKVAKQRREEEAFYR